MKIIGIDPGLRNTGWAILSQDKNIKNKISFIASGTIKTNSKENIFQRLSSLKNELDKVINIYVPDIAAIEETFVNKNPSTSLKLGHARGAIMLTISLHDIECYEFSARLVKQAVTGSGKADKEQIKNMLKFLLPKATYDSDDSADAIAIAICCLNNHGMLEKIR